VTKAKPSDLAAPDFPPVPDVNGVTTRRGRSVE
jgi:hypothetical protein